MQKKRIVEGSQFQFDLEDLVFVGKSEDKDRFIILFSYKHGLEKVVTFKNQNERDNNYNEICRLHSEYYNK